MIRRLVKLYFFKKKWRKKSIEQLRLFEIVETIYSIKPSEIVSYFQIQQFQTTNWFNDITQDELRMLLEPNFLKEKE